MKIKVNKWCIFESQDTKKDWLEEVKNKYIPDINFSFYLQREVLKLAKDDYGDYCIRYRTEFRPDFEDLDVTRICSEYNKILEDVKYKYTPNISTSLITGALESIPMPEIPKSRFNKGVIMNIINKAKEAEKDLIVEKYNVKRKAFIEETVPGKALNSAIAEINKQKDVKVDLDSLFSFSMLTKEDKIEFDKINCETQENIRKVNDKYEELETLLNMAETFEQKESLLHKYGVIKYNKLSNKG